MITICTVPPPLARAGRPLGALAVALGLLAGPVHAAPVVVDCSKAGNTIAKKLASTAKSLEIVVKGACVENIEIERDDVILRTDGVTPASISPADPAKATILLDGAHRVIIDGMGIGLTINSGSTGVSAQRGSTLDVRNCRVQGGSGIGIAAVYGSTVSVDACAVEGHTSGVVAANAASLAITNSAVSRAAGTGITATRAAHVRVGQDLAGTVTAKPVVVSGNATGIAFTESSAGFIVGSTVEDNTATGVNVSRASSAQIGVGSNGLVAPNQIRNNGSSGISVYQASQARVEGNTIEGHGGSGVQILGSSAATVAGNTIRQSGDYGVLVTDASNARVGWKDDGATIAGNLIETSDLDGLNVGQGSSVVVAGNRIQNNGRDGIGSGRGVVRLIGDNVVKDNAGNGIAVSQGTLFQAQGDFNVPVLTDSVQGNGRSGVSLSNTASGDIRKMNISGNAERGIQVSNNSSIRIQDTAVSGNGLGGVAVDGIALFSASVLNTPTPSSGLSVTGHAGWGINCSGAETSIFGDFSGVPGNVPGSNAAGSHNCTGF